MMARNILHGLNQHMNKNLLQKCLDELAKDAPKLDYVRGILETLIALADEKDTFVVPAKPMPIASIYQTAKQIDEATSLDAAAAAALKKIPPTIET